MKTAVDDRFRAEARQFALRFTCEECAHFEHERAACSNGYPTEAHRARELDTCERVIFCKQFELG